jgi:hypothetical protein
LCDTPRGACRMTYGIEKPERMAGQGRAAATAGRRGPQRSEDTGQTWRTLDVTEAERASRRGSREALSPAPRRLAGESGDWGSAPSHRPHSNRRSRSKPKVKSDARR